LFTGDPNTLGFVAFVHADQLGTILALSQATLISAFAVALGSLILLAPACLRFWRKLRHSQAPAPQPPSVQSRADALARTTRDRESLQSLMKEVRDLTALCAQQIDTRVERLERLLADADRRIAASQSDHHPSRTESPLIESRYASPASSPSSSPHRRQDAPRMHGHFPTIDPIAQQVYDLADQGRSPVQIAGALEEHVGKVELILALRG